MERCVDLSGLLEEGLWGYFELPGLERVVPRVEVRKFASLDTEGFDASSIGLASISGTYLEAGAHVISGGKTIDEYPVSHFFQRARVIRLPKVGSGALIERSEIERALPPIEAGDAIIVDTGWGKRWNQEGYVNESPHYSIDAIGALLEKQISILGFDVPCIEPPWSETESEKKGSILRSIFLSGTLLLAPLVNLDSIEREVGTLICLPLYIKGSSGAPVRAVFLEQD